jgi:hypothetical protein
VSVPDGDLPFDAVVIGSERMSVTAFLALPLGVRVQAILEGNVAFFRGTRSVDRVDALKALRKLSAA